MFNNLRIGPRIAIGASLLLMASVGSLTGIHLWVAGAMVSTAEQRELDKTFQILNARIESQGHAAAMVSRLIAEIPDVKRAIAEDDRDRLNALFRPAFVALEEEFGVRQMQFHTVHAHSYLRVHMPDAYGDDLSGFRKTVVAANRERRAVTGLERGVAGIGIRGVVPLFLADEHIGSVELGMSFGQSFFEQFARDYGVDVALYLPWADSGALTVFASTLDGPALLSSEEQQRALEGSVVVKDGWLDGRSVVAYGRAIADYSGEPIGVVEIAMDRAYYDNALGSMAFYGIGIGALLILAGIGGALILARGIARPLAVAVDAADRMAEGDLSADVDSRANDETGILLRSIGRTVRRLRIAVGQSDERARKLESVNKELEAFAYSVSHDLRAPLRSIHGFSELLLRRYRNRLDDAGADYLRRVCDATTRMGVLIDDLLDLSRVTRASLHVERVDLSRVARNVIAELQQREPERRVEFSVEPALEVEGDPHLLRIVMINLLQNAWKFTRFCERPRVVVGAEWSDGVQAIFVKDNGAGFDMQFADKLFGAFERLHHGDQFPGTGIGLATVQRIVQRHGGEVWAHGEEGTGAVFRFTLGVRRSSQQVPTDPLPS